MEELFKVLDADGDGYFNEKEFCDAIGGQLTRLCKEMENACAEGGSSIDLSMFTEMLARDKNGEFFKLVFQVGQYIHYTILLCFGVILHESKFTTNLHTSV